MKYDQMLQNVKNERINIAIATAAELYLEVGIAETKMTDIAEECQLGVASLYRYFGTKQLFTVKAASHIWEMKIAELKDVCSSPAYEAKTGIDQMEALMSIFHTLLHHHASFLRFLSEFENFTIRERLTSDDLSEYRQSVLNAMPLVEKAMKKGIADGTVKCGIDQQLFYMTVVHCLMSICQKFARKQILRPEDLQVSEKELSLAIDMFLAYIRA